MLPTISGEWRVGTAPELRFTPSGKAICSFRAVASQRKNVNNEWVDGPEIWTKVTVWEKLAEHVAESIETGQLVLLIGTIETEEWDGPNGEKRQGQNLTARYVGPSLAFATAKVTKVQRQEGGGGQQSQSSRQAQAQGDPWAPNNDDEPPF